MCGGGQVEGGSGSTCVIELNRYTELLQSLIAQIITKKRCCCKAETV